MELSAGFSAMIGSNVMINLSPVGMLSYVGSFVYDVKSAGLYG